MNRKLLQLLRDNASADAGAKASIRSEILNDTEARVYIYDVIDSWWGANAPDLIKSLGEAGSRDIHLHINSPGGDVFEARAMAAAVVAHPGKVTVHIDGLAASAATYLALSGNVTNITEGGMFMVHNSWTMTWGNKAELRDTAALLEKIDGLIAADYSRKTGKSTEEVAAWMDAETWFTAQEAKDAGFVDAIEANTKRTDSAADASAARWNLSAYANAPKPPAAPPAEDLAAITAHAERLSRLNRSRASLVPKV